MTATRPSILDVRASFSPPRSSSRRSFADLQHRRPGRRLTVPGVLPARPLGPAAGAKAIPSRLLFVCGNGTKLTISLRFCIAGLVIHALRVGARQGPSNPHWCSHLQHQPAYGEIEMSAQDLPATARALSVIVAIALVATALAPLIFTAARVVA